MSRLVSVIIPAYNQTQAVLKETIDSALAQSHRELEILVVDDGSAERDLGWVRTMYGGRVTYLRKENGGPATARNAGIRAAKGDYLAFLDADDIWETDKTALQVAALEDTPDAGLVYATVSRIDEAGKPCGGGGNRQPGAVGNIFRPLFMQNFIPTSTVMVRRECFERVGVFDEARELISVEDYDMWLRITERYGAVYLNRPVTRYRMHAAGISKQVDRSYGGEQLVLKKAMARSMPRAPWMWDVIRARFGQLYFEWGYDHFANGDLAAARAKFRQSLRHTPWNLRRWIYFVSTLLGAPVIAGIRRMKNIWDVSLSRQANNQKGSDPFSQKGVRPHGGRKRVLHILNMLDTGGAERVVLNLAQRIDRDRYELLVCSLGEQGDLSEPFRQLGVPTLAMHRRSGIDWWLPVRLARLLRRERVDMVHTHNVTPWLYGGIAAWLAGVELYHTEHSNLFPNQRALIAAEKVLARLTRVVMAVSDKVRRQLVDGQGLPADKVITVVNGVDMAIPKPVRDLQAEREQLQLNGAEYVIGTVGRLVPVKDHETLLVAFQQLLRKHPAGRLVIVGDGPERGSLESRARDLGIAERVTWLGQRSDVRELLRVFDIFILSSVSEGMPLTVLEAMAAGKPVVATNVGGIHEAVIDGTTGLLVPASWPERLAEAVSALLSDRAKRVAFGRRARERAESQFDLNHMVRRYASAYHHESVS